MLRANDTSVLPPKFRENLCTLPVRDLCPIPLPCNAGNVGAYLQPIYVFSPLLEGYFQDPVTEILTIHLLSLLPKTMYSSLSLHFC